MTDLAAAATKIEFSDVRRKALAERLANLAQHAADRHPPLLAGVAFADRDAEWFVDSVRRLNSSWKSITDVCFSMRGDCLDSPD